MQRLADRLLAAHLGNGVNQREGRAKHGPPVRKRVMAPSVFLIGPARRAVLQAGRRRHLEAARRHTRAVRQSSLTDSSNRELRETSVSVVD
jgi:hypothetical protein